MLYKIEQGRKHQLIEMKVGALLLPMSGAYPGGVGDSAPRGSLKKKKRERKEETEKKKKRGKREKRRKGDKKEKILKGAIQGWI